MMERSSHELPEPKRKRKSLPCPLTRTHIEDVKHCGFCGLCPSLAPQTDTCKERDGEKCDFQTMRQHRVLSTVAPENGWRVCLNCGVYERFQDMTDECCMTKTGQKCIFRESVGASSSSVRRSIPDDEVESVQSDSDAVGWLFTLSNKARTASVAEHRTCG